MSNQPHSDAHSYETKCCSCFVAGLYLLALKHHDFLKWEIKNLLDARIIQKSMSPWAKPIVIIKRHTPEGAPQQFCLYINHRKVNSLLPAVMPAGGTMKGALTLMPLPQIN